MMSKVMQSGPAFLLRIVRAKSMSLAMIVLPLFASPFPRVLRRSRGLPWAPEGSRGLPWVRAGSLPRSCRRTAPRPVDAGRAAAPSAHRLVLRAEQLQRMVHLDDVVQRPAVRPPAGQHFVAHERGRARGAAVSRNAGVQEVAPRQVGQ